MQQFWVVGGEYRDSHFQDAVGGTEEWYGPFADFDEAKEEWAKRAWKTVDEAKVRYRIERFDPDESPPCTD